PAPGGLDQRGELVADVVHLAGGDAPHQVPVVGGQALRIGIDGVPCGRDAVQGEDALAVRGHDLDLGDGGVGGKRVDEVQEGLAVAPGEAVGDPLGAGDGPHGGEQLAFDVD